MKYLYLLRHGKAETASALQSDHDRVLAFEGKRETRRIARQFLKREDWVKPAILCSSARRALQTAQLFMHVTGQTEETIRIEKVIYQTGVEGLVSLLQETDDSIKAVMIVGHNPVLTELAGWLAPGFVENMPTGGLVCIKLQVGSWNEIGRGRGLLEGLLFPESGRKDRRKAEERDRLAEKLSQAMDKVLDRLSYPATVKRQFLVDRASEKLAKKLLKSD